MLYYGAIHVLVVRVSSLYVHINVPILLCRSVNVLWLSRSCQDCHQEGCVEYVHFVCNAYRYVAGGKPIMMSAYV